MKRCPQCGRKYPDENKFCNVCGGKLQGQQPSQRQQNPYPQQHSYSQQTKGKKSKKNKKGLAIKIGVAVGVVVAGAVAIFVGKDFLHISGGSGENVIVYLSENNKYEILMDTNKKEVIELPIGMDKEYAYQDKVVFSPDGNYLYLMTDSTDSYTIDLWRCEYRKLGKDSSENEKYIQLIASDVDEDKIYFFEENQIMYEDENSELYYYDGRESQPFANVSSVYYVEGEKYIAYETEGDDGTCSLFGIDFEESPYVQILLAQGYDQLYDIQDFSSIFYTQYNEDDELEFFVTGFDKEPQKLGNGVLDACGSDGKSAYYVEEGEKIQVSDWLTDSSGRTEYIEKMEEALQDEKYKKLYDYYDGKSYLISNRVIQITDEFQSIFGMGMIPYSSTEYVEPIDMGKYSWKEVSDGTFEADFRKELYFSKVNFYFPENGKKVHLTEDAWFYFYYNIWPNGSEQKITFNDKYILSRSSEAAYIAEVKNGEIDKFDLITDSGSVLNQTDSEFYYTSDEYEVEGLHYYNLYVYRDGESTCLAKGILEEDATLYEDGKILIYTGYNESEKNYTAELINSNGEREEIGEGRAFVRCKNDEIMYLNGGNFWIYKNGTRTLVASGAKITDGWIWSKNSMKVQWSNM